MPSSQRASVTAPSASMQTGSKNFGEGHGTDEEVDDNEAVGDGVEHPVGLPPAQREQD